MYTLRITNRDGRVYTLPNWFDEEWAHRHARHLRTDWRIKEVEVIPAPPDAEKGRSQCSS